MTTFDEREKSYERKFQQEQELAFKIKARRNKLMGLWAAGHLGFAGDAAETYARDLVISEMQSRSDEPIIGKLAADLAKKGVAIDAVRLRVELERWAAEAKRQLGPKP